MICILIHLLLVQQRLLNIEGGHNVWLKWIASIRTVHARRVVRLLLLVAVFWGALSFIQIKDLISVVNFWLFWARLLRLRLDAFKCQPVNLWGNGLSLQEFLLHTRGIRESMRLAQLNLAQLQILHVHVYEVFMRYDPVLFHDLDADVLLDALSKRELLIGADVRDPDRWRCLLGVRWHGEGFAEVTLAPDGLLNISHRLLRTIGLLWVLCLRSDVLLPFCGAVWIMRRGFLLISWIRVTLLSLWPSLIDLGNCLIKLGVYANPKFILKCLVESAIVITGIQGLLQAPLSLPQRLRLLHLWIGSDYAFFVLIIHQLITGLPPARNLAVVVISIAAIAQPSMMLAMAVDVVLWRVVEGPRLQLSHSFVHLRRFVHAVFWRYARDHIQYGLVIPRSWSLYHARVNLLL